MCDYGLQAVASRPAKIGERLVSTSFRGTSTRGFAANDKPAVAICLLPGTAFDQDVGYKRNWLWTKNTRKMPHTPGKMPHKPGRIIGAPTQGGEGDSMSA